MEEFELFVTSRSWSAVSIGCKPDELHGRAAARDRPSRHRKPGEKLALGVAARLSRYLQVLIQARKMGKETISSQELADYTT